MKKYSKQFVKQCVLGDRQSQQRLFEELYAVMFRTCRRYLKDHAEAEDATMRGFMKAFQALKEFRYQNEYGLFGWIRRIMVNEALGSLRKNYNFMLSLEEETNHHPVEPEVFSALEAEELEAAVLILPAGYRTVFNLYVVEGYDHKEIADLLKISENTSKSQLSKARAKLRDLIEKNEKSYASAGR